MLPYVLMMANIYCHVINNGFPFTYDKRVFTTMYITYDFHECVVYVLVDI